MSFERVRTVADLDSLDEAEIIAGYTEFVLGDPEPGPNRGRAYWHGWRSAAMDRGQIKGDAIHEELVREYLASLRAKMKSKKRSRK